MKRKTITIKGKKLKFYILDYRKFESPNRESPCDRCEYQDNPNCENFRNPLNLEENFSDFCCTMGGEKEYTTYIPFPGTIEEFYGEEKTSEDYTTR